MYLNFKLFFLNVKTSIKTNRVIGFLKLFYNFEINIMFLVSYIRYNISKIKLKGFKLLQTAKVQNLKTRKFYFFDTVMNYNFF